MAAGLAGGYQRQPPRQLPSTVPTPVSQRCDVTPIYLCDTGFSEMGERVHHRPSRVSCPDAGPRQRGRPLQRVEGLNG